MCRHVAISPVRYLRYLHHYASGVPRSACMPLQSVDSIAYDSRAGFALGWDLGCHLECLVAHGSRELSVCVPPSFSQNPSGTRKAPGFRRLLVSPSNLFATGTSIKLSKVQFSIRHGRVRRSHDQWTPPAAVRLDARLQGLLGTRRQCRAAG
jgi:hypothetical protein